MTEDTKPKKKPVNGKAKGSGFELTIAKLFSDTFAPLNFKRTQSSGAIVGGQNDRFVTHYSADMLSAFVGDIFPCNEADVLKEHGWQFKRTIECKFYKDADSFTALFKNPQVGGWFEQAAEDAAKLKRNPLLIFKFNHTPVFFAIDSTDELPKGLTSLMELAYNVKYNDKPAARTIKIGLLTEALVDLEWWKLYDPTFNI